MDVLVFLATFAVIFPAELPDKSMFTAIVLVTRYRPLPVWLGLASAFLVHVIIAIAAGSVLSLLPEKLVTGVVALAFFTFAMLLLFKHNDDDNHTTDIKGPTSTSFPKVFATAFFAVFVTEWGDLTQLATINLSARYDDPLSVGLGSLSALWLVTGLGVLLGKRLVDRLPLRQVKRVAGLVLLALAVWALVDFMRL